MSSIPRTTWVKLYKDLIRASDNFPQYNYRSFARRRVRDYFEKYRNQPTEKLFEEGREALAVINRQVLISKAFPQHKLVVEEPNPSRV